MNYLQMRRKTHFGRFKIGTPKSLLTNELWMLGANSYSFVCSDDHKTKIKFESIEKAGLDEVKFEEFFICLSRQDK